MVNRRSVRDGEVAASISDRALAEDLFSEKTTKILYSSVEDADRHGVCGVCADERGEVAMVEVEQFRASAFSEGTAKDNDYQFEEERDPEAERIIKEFEGHQANDPEPAHEAADIEDAANLVGRGPNVWMKVVDGKYVPEDSKVVRLLDKLSVEQSYTNRSQYLLTCVAFGRKYGGEPVKRSPKLESILSSAKHSEFKRVMLPRNRSHTGQPKGGDKKEDKGQKTFIPKEDFKRLRADAAKLRKYLDGDKRFAEVFSVAVESGDSELINILSEIEKARTPKIDLDVPEIARRWLRGSYLKAADLLFELSLVKKKFPTSYPGAASIRLMVGEVLQPQSFLEAQAEAHNQAVHSLFGNTEDLQLITAASGLNGTQFDQLLYTATNSEAYIGVELDASFGMIKGRNQDIALGLQVAPSVGPLLSVASTGQVGSSPYGWLWITHTYRSAAAATSDVQTFIVKKVDRDIQLRPGDRVYFSAIEASNAGSCGCGFSARFLNQRARSWNNIQHSQNGNIKVLATEQASHNKEMHSLNGNTSTPTLATVTEAPPVLMPKKEEANESISDMKKAAMSWIADILANEPTKIDAATIAKVNSSYIADLPVKNLFVDQTQFQQIRTQGFTTVPDVFVDQAGAVQIAHQNQLEFRQEVTVEGEPVVLNEAGVSLLEIASAKSYEVLANAIRTRNPVLDAQTIARFIAYLKNSFSTDGKGLIFSSSSAFAAALLYTTSWVPRMSKTFPIGNANFAPAVPNARMETYPGAFPLGTSPTAGAPVVRACFVNMQTLVNWISYGTNAVPGSFESALLESQVTIIPVTDDIQSSSDLAAAYTLCHLDYPFRQLHKTGTQKQNDGTDITADAVSAIPTTMLTHITGVKDNVIFVYVPGSADRDVTLTVAGQDLQLANNFAAPVDIGTALYNWFPNAGFNPFSAALQTMYRIYGRSASSDLAHWVGAISSKRWRRAPTMNSDATLSFAVVNSRNPATVGFNQGQPLWLPATAANVNAALDSLTAPTFHSGSLVRGPPPPDQSNNVRPDFRIPMRNSVIGVLMAMNTSFSFSKAIWPIEFAPSTIAERFYRINDAITMLMDAECQVRDWPAQMIYNTGDVAAADPDRAYHYQNKIGPQKAYMTGKNSFPTLYSVLNMWRYMDVTVVNILYRSNPTTYAAYPLAYQSPMSRIASASFEGRLNSVIAQEPEADWTDVTTINEIHSKQIGVGVWVRYIKPVQKVSAYKKWVAVKKNLTTGFWADPSINLLRFVPNDVAGLPGDVTFMTFPTDYPDDGVGLGVTMAGYGFYTGRTPGFTELVHGAFQPCMRILDSNRLGIGIVNTPEYFIQKRSRTVKVMGLSAATSSIWIKPWGGAEEEVEQAGMDESFQGQSGGKPAEPKVDGTPEGMGTA